MIAHAWQILVVALAGWLNRQQQDVVEYLQEENRVLCEHLKGKRLRFTDDQRRRLASKGKVLGRRMLMGKVNTAGCYGATMRPRQGRSARNLGQGDRARDPPAVLTAYSEPSSEPTSSMPSSRIVGDEKTNFRVLNFQSTLPSELKAYRW